MQAIRQFLESKVGVECAPNLASDFKPLAQLSRLFAGNRLDTELLNRLGESQDRFLTDWADRLTEADLVELNQLAALYDQSGEFDKLLAELDEVAGSPAQAATESLPPLSVVTEHKACA